MSANKKLPTYAEASAELESILEKIEGGEVDVDEVVTLVRRGTELIRFCRERLDAARLEVSKVVADLDVLEQSQAGVEGDDDAEPGEAEPDDDADARTGGKLPF